MIEVAVSKPSKRNVFIKKVKTIYKKSIYNAPRKENFTGIIKDKRHGKANYVNGVIHKEDGPAIEYENGTCSWYYKGVCYSWDNDFTVETWIIFVENLKREEELKIFK